MNYFSQLQPNSDIIIEDNRVTVDKLKKKQIDKIITFPCTGNPKYNTGMVITIIKEFYSKTPMLVICLGH